MVKRRLEIVFTLIMALYFITRWIRPFVDNDFVKNYLTDIYFVPAMCLFALFFIRKIKKGDTLQIPLSYILIQVIVVSFYFEWYLPRFYGRPGWYTSDWIDVLMYIIGGLLFISLQRMERKLFS